MRAALALVIALGASSLAEAAPDYAPASSEWNGLSQLVELAGARGCEVTAGDELDWSELRKNDVLWFVYPRVPVDGVQLERFLGGGGRVVIADDFGAAAPALKEALKLHRGQPPQADTVERYHANPNLPMARAGSPTALGRSTETLVANHPASFRAEGLPATFWFEPDAALVVEERFRGGGYAVAIADPSVLINNMLEIEGNRSFAEVLVDETCRAHQDRIRLFTQTFVQRGELPASLDERAPPGTSAARFNELVDRFNQDAKGALGDRRATIMLGLAVGLVASFLLLGAFPSRGPIRDRWTKAGRIADPVPSVDVWDLAGPLATLREEAVERLSKALGAPVDFDWTGPSALEQKVRDKLSPEAAKNAGELWRLFKRIRWRNVDGELVPDERVARRQLSRAHALASALFADIEKS